MCLCLRVCLCCDLKCREVKSVSERGTSAGKERQNFRRSLGILGLSIRWGNLKLRSSFQNKNTLLRYFSNVLYASFLLNSSESMF